MVGIVEREADTKARDGGSVFGGESLLFVLVHSEQPSIAPRSTLVRIVQAHTPKK